MEAFDRYSELLQKHGDSILSLGWNHGADKIRKEIILSGFDFNNKNILDIGCGYGDLNAYVEDKNCRYTGIDVVPGMINLARKKYKKRFINADFTTFGTDEKFDIIIGSGIFNVFEGGYGLINKYFRKALSMCNEGVCFNFLSDKVEWKIKHHFHSSPETILTIAYTYSRNVVLRNDYMPFEFTIFVYKENGFDDRRIFLNYESRNITK